MNTENVSKNKKILKHINVYFVIISVLFLAVAIFLIFGFFHDKTSSYNISVENIKDDIENKEIIPIENVLPLDKDDYDARLIKLANIPIPAEPKPTIVTTKVVDKKTGKTTLVKTTVPGKPIVQKPSAWPVKTVYPNNGAILPFHRIIAYYGNLYSKKMGALGEYKEDEMLRRLMVEVNKWEKADPTTPVLPALHYVAVTAQGSKGSDGKYRLRMPFTEIDKVLAMADKIHAIVFLDVQVALSNLQSELPALEKYLKMPNVHLGIDPEFSMKTGARPGTVVGTTDATDINYAASYLAKLVKENNLPPKILIVHRYTQKMVTNYAKVVPLAEVQILVHMDGWGESAKKINTYKQFVYKEPIQFTGFKIFYKNDTIKPNSVVMTPEQLLKLSPQPIYIQYQ